MIPDSWGTVVLIRNEDTLVVEGLTRSGGVALCLRIALEKVMESEVRALEELAEVISAIEGATEGEFASKFTKEIVAFQVAADDFLDALKKYRRKDEPNG